MDELGLKDEYLDKKKELWLTKLDVKEMFLAKLGAPPNPVISDSQVQSLKCESDIVQRRDKLITFLKDGDAAKFRKFCRILEKSQAHLCADLPSCFKGDVQAAKKAPAQAGGPIPHPEGAYSSSTAPSSDEVDVGRGAMAEAAQAVGPGVLTAPAQAAGSTVSTNTLEVRESMIIPAEVNIHRTDDIVVAVLDTGIRDCHPDFQGAVIEATNFVPGEDADLRVDSFGHGTFVAGIIHQYATGVQILNLKVGNTVGKVTGNVIAALQWINDWEIRNHRKVHIINMSFNTERNNQIDKLLSDMSREKVIVCAATNYGQLRSETIMYPANHGQLLCIGSCNKYGEKVSHSSVGQELHFLFPGKNVVSYNSEWTNDADKYRPDGGTSFAAPHCSAVIAWILAMITDPTWRAKLGNCHNMKGFLKELCGNREHNKREGYGMPNLDRVTVDRINLYVKEHPHDL